MSNYENTHSQINQQRNSGHERPTVLISRHDESIQTAQILNEYDSEGRQFVVFNDRGEEAVKPIAIKNLSDDTQEQLANTLAKSAERSPEEWQREVQKDLAETALEAVEVAAPEAVISESRDELDKDDSKGEILSQANNIARDFTNQYEGIISEVASNQSRLLQIFDESTRLLSHFNIGNISKQSLIQQLNENLGRVRAIINQSDETLDPVNNKASVLLQTTDELSQTILRDVDADKDEKYKVKSIAQAAEDLKANINRAMGISDEFSAEITHFSRLISDFEGDQWGPETYSAQLRHVLDQLDQIASERMRRLKYTESEFVTFRSIANK